MCDDATNEMKAKSLKTGYIIFQLLCENPSNFHIHRLNSSCSMQYIAFQLNLLVLDFVEYTFRMRRRFTVFMRKLITFSSFHKDDATSCRFIEKIIIMSGL